MPCAGLCIPGCDIAARGALWRVARVRVAHGIAGGIGRRLAGFQRVAGHCGAARGGFYCDGARMR